MALNIDFTNPEFMLLLLNYIMLGGYALYRFFNPEEWFIKSTVSVFIVYMLTLLILVVPAFFLNGVDFCPLIMFLILGICIVFIVKNEVKEFGTGWVFPLGLYLFSVAQEIFKVLNSKNMDMYYSLVSWFLFGFIFIPFFLGVIGSIFKRLLPAIAKEHMKIADENVATSPSAYALWGIIYSIWMLIRLFLQTSI